MQLLHKVVHKITLVLNLIVIFFQLLDEELWAAHQPYINLMWEETKRCEFYLNMPWAHKGNDWEVGR